ncbi:hypothetical protein ACEYYH_07345 [Microbacterium trichothecenolyticum]|uniref:hypothetical protein n=1 Tax=Microbacterium trichothecenolyticum TaxID=69370 RepID=UPI0035BE5D73
MTPRHVRALRGTAAAWVATVIAATAHTLGGGGAPSPAFVTAVGILAAPFAVALIGRRLSAWRIGVTVLASQAMFHVAFAVTADADPAALHGHHVTHLGGDLSAVVVPDTPMLAAHVLAALATLAGLYGGERMLRALGRGIRSLFSRLRGVALRAPLPRFVPPPAGSVLAAARIVLSDVSRRGPPALV